MHFHELECHLLKDKRHIFTYFTCTIKYMQLGTQIKLDENKTSKIKSKNMVKSIEALEPELQTNLGWQIIRRLV